MNGGLKKIIILNLFSYRDQDSLGRPSPLSCTMYKECFEILSLLYSCQDMDLKSLELSVETPVRHLKVKHFFCQKFQIALPECSYYRTLPTDWLLLSFLVQIGRYFCQLHKAPLKYWKKCMNLRIDGKISKRLRQSCNQLLQTTRPTLFFPFLAHYF